MTQTYRQLLSTWIIQITTHSDLRILFPAPALSFFYFLPPVLFSATLRSYFCLCVTVLHLSQYNYLIIHITDLKL
jgi:hypothetical protein